MQLVTDLKKLEEIMAAFYTLTGIRFTIFDSDYHEVIAYPERDCRFCEMMKQNPTAAEFCRESDRRSFAACQKSGEMIVYHCHAGLIEAALPLKEGGTIIGYVMFGQITDRHDREIFHRQVLDSCASYGIDRQKLLSAVKQVRYKSGDHIVAASHILETCTCYMLLKEMITPKNDRIVTEVNHYIDEHISEEIDVRTLCADLQISRTKLYEIFQDSCRVGIGEYIRTKRLEYAKKLLKTTDMAIRDIADAVGFSDYNYFSRVYKRHFGKSPMVYRKVK